MVMLAILGSNAIPRALMERHASQLMANHQMTIDQCDGQIRSVEAACAILDTPFMSMPKSMADRICDMATREYMAEIQLKEISGKLEETARNIAESVARASGEYPAGYRELELVKGRVDAIGVFDGVDPLTFATFAWAKSVVLTAIIQRQLELLRLQLGGEEA